MEKKKIFFSYNFPITTKKKQQDVEIDPCLFKIHNVFNNKNNNFNKNTAKKKKQNT